MCVFLLFVGWCGSCRLSSMSQQFSPLHFPQPKSVHIIFILLLRKLFNALYMYPICGMNEPDCNQIHLIYFSHPGPPCQPRTKSTTHTQTCNRERVCIIDFVVALWCLLFCVCTRLTDECRRFCELKCYIQNTYTYMLYRSSIPFYMYIHMYI